MNIIPIFILKINKQQKNFEKNLIIEIFLNIMQ